MTPGIKAAEKAGIQHRIHEYSHDAGSASWGMEAAEKLGVDPRRVFKTLVLVVDSQALVVAVVPVAAMLSMKQLARAAGGKKAVMAERQAVERATGYVLGGVSPLGQKRRLKTFIDDSARPFATVFVSGGRRGLEIELVPQDLARLTNGMFARLQQE